MEGHGEEEGPLGAQEDMGPTVSWEDSGDVGGLWGPPTAVWIHCVWGRIHSVLGTTLGAWRQDFPLLAPRVSAQSLHSSRLQPSPLSLDPPGPSPASLPLL